MKFNAKQSITLLAFVLVCFSVFIYWKTIHLFPAFMHSWTQSDRYALALGFIQNGFDFFHPRTFNLMVTDGITRVDFPVNEYIVALFMKLFGIASPVVFRIYTLVIGLTGLVFLFLFTKKITGSEIKAWLVVFFVFLSPVYLYYQNGFIPTIPALAFSFIAYYYYYSYQTTLSKKYLAISIIFFVLAALIRMPFVILLSSLFVQHLYYQIKQRQFYKFETLVFVSGFVLFGIYFFYNLHLYRLYGSIFLDHLMPARSWTELREIIQEMYQHWALHYFTIWHYLLFIVIIILSNIKFFSKKITEAHVKKLTFQLFILKSGTIIYFLFMARQYYSHDYYFLDTFFIPLVLLLIYSLNKINFEKPLLRDSFGFAFLIFTLLFFISTQKTQAERYSTGPWDRVEITRDNFLGTETFLDQLGISKQAKILVIDAYTYNVPLILMNRQGYTVLGTTHKNIATSLFWCKWDYVAIQDIYLVSDVIKNYPLITSMLERVAGTGKVSFYKRSEKFNAKTLQQFLSINPSTTLYSADITFDQIQVDTNYISGHHNISQQHFLSSPHSAILDSTIEFGTTVKLNASDLKNTDNLKMLVSTAVWTDHNPDKVQLVAAISSSSQTLFYQSFALSDYIRPDRKWQPLEFQFVLPAFRTAKDELKVYLWNPGKMVVYYDDLEVIIYK